MSGDPLRFNALRYTDSLSGVLVFQQRYDFDRTKTTPLFLVSAIYLRSPAGQHAILRQFVEQCLGINKIRRTEAFGEPAVDSLKQLSDFLLPASFLPLLHQRNAVVHRFCREQRAPEHIGGRKEQTESLLCCFFRGFVCELTSRLSLSTEAMKHGCKHRYVHLCRRMRCLSGQKSGFATHFQGLIGITK